MIAVTVAWPDSWSSLLSHILSSPAVIAVVASITGNFTAAVIGFLLNRRIKRNAQVLEWHGKVIQTLHEKVVNGNGV